MANVSYEFSGHKFDDREADRLNQAIGRDFYSAETHITPSQSNFYFSNSRVAAGFIPLSLHRSVGIKKTVVRRSQADIRNNSSDVYLIWLPIRGAVTIVQNGNSTVLTEDSIGLSSSNEPLYIDTTPDRDDVHLSFQILAPAHLITQALLDPRRLCGISFPTKHGGPRIARDLFPSLFHQAEFTDRESLQSLALSGMSALFHALREQSEDYCKIFSIKEVKLQKLLDYIELHYSDPDLTTEKVAKACEISPRYLHYLLKSKGGRFCDSLWRLRLNSACEQLKDVSLMRRTIAEIAYSSGFKSSAHFSRAFRSQFACSPKEFRRSHGIPNGPEP